MTSIYINCKVRNIILYNEAVLYQIIWLSFGSYDRCTITNTLTYDNR